jgi:FAD/FMN-containing dehydrogenase
VEPARASAIAQLFSSGLEFRVEEPVRTDKADDFGHLVHHTPRAVFTARSADDVASVLRPASSEFIRMPVAARGMAHSTDGQAQVDDGFVIDMSEMNAIGPIQGDRITVGAGATWRSVVRATVGAGLTPPVLTDYLDLSIGGTLSVGGIGGMSHQHGLQTDNVVELEVVTGRGSVRTCSAQREPDLFAAVLGGLGQCAVITAATVRLIPAPRRVRRWQVTYPNTDTLLRDQRMLLRDSRFDYLEGVIQPGDDGWQYTLDVASYRELRQDDLPSGPRERTRIEFDDMDYLAFVERMDEGVAYLRSTGDWFLPHPWWNAFLPDAAADAVLEASIADLKLDDIGTNGLVLVYPVPTNVVRTPLVRVPDAEVMFLVGILRTSTDAVAGEKMVPKNVALFRTARDKGGVAYPISTIPFTRADWERHFGPEWPVLTAAMRRFDPTGILCPGQRIR